MKTYEIRLRVEVSQWFNVSAENYADAVEAARLQAEQEFSPWIEHSTVIDSEEVIEQSTTL